MIAIKGIFNNYEFVKLGITHPNIANCMILFLFLAVLVLLLRRDSGFFGELLDRTQTDQLKGLAIFCVILGHLWVHVSKETPSIVLSGDGVAMFLILSGFGLTVSWKDSNGITFAGFFAKRLKRVMIPYWIATLLILMLDYILLDRHLDADGIILTILGINISPDLTRLDYVRWFITFIILWYMLFYFAWRYLPTVTAMITLLIIAVVLFPVNYYLLHAGWYQFCAFPIGCAMGVYRSRISGLFERKKNLLVFLSFVIASLALAYKAALNEPSVNEAIYARVPTIILSFAHDNISVILCLAVIFLMMRICQKGYYSKVLIRVGRYSYELFLLHGVFLIKYNPLIKGVDSLSVVFEFCSFLLFTCFMAYLLAKASDVFYAKMLF